MLQRAVHIMELKNPRVKEILAILAAGGLITTALIIPSAPIALNYISKKWQKYKKRELGIIVKRFIKQELVNFQEKDGVQILTINEKGQQRLLKYDFDKLELKSKKRDNYFRVVIFDIPEGLKKNRDLFRKKLIELGFKFWQDSVFISAYPCKNEIDFLCNYLNISPYVTLFVLKEVESGEELFFKTKTSSNDQLM